MTEAIIVALITAASVIGAQIIIAKQNGKKQDADRARLDQKTDDRLASIERKLDEHNGYADKIGRIELAIVRIEQELSHR